MPERSFPRVIRALLASLVVQSGFVAGEALAVEGARESQSGRAEPSDRTGAAQSRRADSLREQSSVSGGTGLLHLVDPTASASGTFRVSVLFDSYEGSAFLCNRQTGCPAVGEDVAGHFGTMVALTLVPASFLEAYATLDSYVNSNDAGEPSLVSSVGNSTFALKGFTPTPVAGVLRFGGALELGFLGNSGAVGVAGGGTSARLLAMAQTDFRGADEQGPPLRARLNVGYRWDNSSALIEQVERERGTPITRIERFGLEINRVDQIEMGAGVDGIFGVVRPFVEWNVGIPLNRQGYTCFPTRAFQGDGCLATDARLSAFPSRLTLGARLFPWLTGLGITAALDIGTSGTSSFIEELAPTEPWALWLGASYGFDAIPAPPVVTTKTIEKLVALPPPPRFALRGFVHEQDKQEGIAKAIVAFDGRDLSGTVTARDGHFVSSDLEPGTYTLSVEAAGYELGQCSGTISPDKAPAPPDRAPAAPDGTKPASPEVPNGAVQYFELDCPLKALPPLGSLSGQVRSLTGSTTLSGATVKLRDHLGRELAVTTDANGSFRFESIPPGSLALVVDFDGFLAHAEVLELSARADMRREVGLRPRPKPGHVRRVASELVLSQPIRFDGDATEPTADSIGVLEEVADLMLHAPEIGRVEVQVHTDSSGQPAADEALTERRALSIREWLISHGIAATRLSARGLGSSHPVSPNVTPAGRARNRRVKLVITE